MHGRLQAEQLRDKHEKLAHLYALTFGTKGCVTGPAKDDSEKLQDILSKQDDDDHGCLLPAAAFICAHCCLLRSCSYSIGSMLSSFLTFHLFASYAMAARILHLLKPLYKATNTAKGKELANAGLDKIFRTLLERSTTVEGLFADADYMAPAPACDGSWSWDSKFAHSDWCSQNNSKTKSVEDMKVYVEIIAQCLMLDLGCGLRSFWRMLQEQVSRHLLATLLAASFLTRVHLLSRSCTSSCTRSCLSGARDTPTSTPCAPWTIPPATCGGTSSST